MSLLDAVNPVRKLHVKPPEVCFLKEGKPRKKILNTKPPYLLYTNKVPSMSVFSYKRHQLHLGDILVHTLL